MKLLILNLQAVAGFCLLSTISHSIGEERTNPVSKVLQNHFVQLENKTSTVEVAPQRGFRRFLLHPFKINLGLIDQPQPAETTPKCRDGAKGFTQFDFLLGKNELPLCPTNVPKLSQTAPKCRDGAKGFTQFDFLLGKNELPLCNPTIEPKPAQKTPKCVEGTKWHPQFDFLLGNSKLTLCQTTQPAQLTASLPHFAKTTPTETPSTVFVPVTEHKTPIPNKSSHSSTTHTTLQPTAPKTTQKTTSSNVKTTTRSPKPKQTATVKPYTPRSTLLHPTASKTTQFVFYNTPTHAAFTPLYSNISHPGTLIKSTTSTLYGQTPSQAYSKFITQKSTPKRPLTTPYSNMPSTLNQSKTSTASDHYQNTFNTQVNIPKPSTQTYFTSSLPNLPTASSLSTISAANYQNLTQLYSKSSTLETSTETTPHSKILGSTAPCFHTITTKKDQENKWLLLSVHPSVYFIGKPSKQQYPKLPYKLLRRQTPRV